MERFPFTPEVAFTPTEEFLEGVTCAPLTMPLRTGVPAQAAIFRFAPGGRIGRHPATDPQILAVIEGSGSVSGTDGEAEPIATGDAVFLEEGEVHEMTSAAGMTVLILEGGRLLPYRRG